MKRRAFLAAASLGAASYRRALGANDKIQVGIIGLGGNGFGQHVEGVLALKDKAQIVAVCDIYKPRLAQGVAATGARGYHDYNDLLADKNVEAVIISTPDHWHATMAIDAMRAGKDVDVEKPMSLTIEEAREMVRVSQQTGRVLAVDSEHMAHGLWKPAKEAIARGLLGNLMWSQTSRSRNSREPAWEYDIDAGASPENLDWARWLGPAAKTPFSKERFFRWRRFWEYGGGITTDLYYHHIAPLIHITGRSCPVRATAAGGHYAYSAKVVEVPDTFIMTLQFASRHTLLVGGSLANSLELPIAVRGHEANMRFFGGTQMRPDYLVIEPESPYASEFRDKVQTAGLPGKWVQPGGGRPQADFRSLARPKQDEAVSALLGEAEVKAEYEDAVRKNNSLQTDQEERLAFFAHILERRAAAASQPAFRIDAGPSEDFHENFFRCIRTREKPVLDGELGFLTQVAVCLGVEAYRKDKVAFFDPASGRIVDAPVGA